MKILSSIISILLLASCASMIAPAGGDKDIYPPKLLNTEIIENSKILHSKTIRFEFNEYIQLNKWEKYFYISPPTKKRIQKKIKGQALFITIEEMLNKNTTYYVALNSCIKDNNEGNVLDSLKYIFSANESFDTLTLSGNLQDSYTLNPLENAWVMLFEQDANDSLIFKETPNYIAKTNKNGIFHFPNLKDENYKIAALTDFDFIYNKEEKMAFLDRFLNPKMDSFISLFAFDPITKIDSINSDSLVKKIDRSAISYIDSIIKKEDLHYGNLKIITNESSPCVFQLLQNEKVISEIYFSKKPYVIDEISAGTYKLKYIVDSNKDSIWNTGNWEKRMQPEKVFNFPSEITISSNWDLELEWIIQE